MVTGDGSVVTAFGGNAGKDGPTLTPPPPPPPVTGVPLLVGFTWTGPVLTTVPSGNSGGDSVVLVGRNSSVSQRAGRPNGRRTLTQTP